MQDHLRAGDAVGDRVMHLEDQRRPPPAQTLHHGQLPKGPRSVEGASGEPGHDLSEDPVRPGGRRHHPADVRFEGEVRVVDPDGVVEAERDCHEPAAERRQQVQAPPRSRRTCWYEKPSLAVDGSSTIVPTTFIGVLGVSR